MAPPNPSSILIRHMVCCILHRHFQSFNRRSKVHQTALTSSSRLQIVVDQFGDQLKNHVASIEDEGPFVRLDQSDGTDVLIEISRYSEPKKHKIVEVDLPIVRDNDVLM